MPDDLNVNKPISGGNNEDGSQITPNPSPSPLEESTPPSSSVPPAPSAPEPTSAPEPERPEPATSEPSPTPAPPAPPSPAGGEESETAKAPDTDEFLKSILDEKPVTQAATPEESIAGAPSKPAPAAPAASAVPPPISGESALDGGRDQAPKIKDEVSGLDQITGPSEEPKTGGPGETKPISSDIFSAAAAAKPAGKSSSLKLVILILVALVVVVGGYILFTQFFGKSTSTTPTTTTPVSTASSEITATTKATLDDQRKSDLHTIQQALINYFAAQSKYPTAEKLVLLSTSGNIIEKELVPTYINKLPADPVATKSYGYKSDGKTFTLSAVLDNTSDLDVTLEGGLSLFKVTPSTVFESTTPTASATQSPAASATPFASASSSPTASTEGFPTF